MSGFLLIAGSFILLTVLLALVRILRGPSDAERLMAAQLLGTGGVSALLLLGSAIDLSGATDLALLLALLAAFAAVAFVAGLGAKPTGAPAAHLTGRPGRASARLSPDDSSTAD